MLSIRWVSLCDTCGKREFEKNTNESRLAIVFILFYWDRRKNIRLLHHFKITALLFFIWNRQIFMSISFKFFWTDFRSYTLTTRFLVFVFLSRNSHFFLPLSVYRKYRSVYPKSQPVKKLEYVYFTIYHYCSKQSYFHDDLSVRLKSMYLLALSVGGWILFLQLLFLRFIKHAWFSSHPGGMFYALTIYTGITLLFHRILIVKEHDQRIFNKYVSNWQNNSNKRRDLFLALSVAAAPYLMMLGVKMFFPR